MEFYATALRKWEPSVQQEVRRILQSQAESSSVKTASIVLPKEPKDELVRKLGLSASALFTGTAS